MSEQQWTDDGYRIWEGNRIVAEYKHLPDHNPDDGTRAVECRNAMIGIPDPAAMVASWREQAARIAELEEQNKNLLDLDIQSLNIERGKLDARFNGNAATKILAASFGDQFRSVEGAENFITMNLTNLSQPDPLPLEVTIRRVGGKSTTDVLGELRARIAALEAELTAEREAVRVLGIGHRIGAKLRNKLAAMVGEDQFRNIMVEMEGACDIDPIDAMTDVLANPIARAAVEKTQ